jgi:hypothetical protein
MLLGLDSFSETFVPRSRISDFLMRHADGRVEIAEAKLATIDLSERWSLETGLSKEHLARLPTGSVQTVVTSTPYWGVRIYGDWFEVGWPRPAPLGHEQTPEEFIRHTIEFLHLLKPAITQDGTARWNLMDTCNTRTQSGETPPSTCRALR